MGDVAIRVNHISKRYQIGEFHEKTLRAQLPAKFHQLLGRQAAKPAAASNAIWALKDVSFELKKGEVLGVIGANGSGKSTLLRILCGVTRPTLGWVGINGRIGSLLGVGTGFNPDLTGRENVYLNGAILGLKRAEITRRFDEIVAFSEIEQFLDTPVKYYSSGMHVRLAFAVAVNLDADILLIDEVLAVGDAAFRQKSMARMAQMVRGEGRTIILVSHDSSSILSLSTKCIYLSHGALIAEGDPATVLANYENDFFPKIELEAIKAEAPVRGGDGRVRITALQFLDAHSRQPAASIASGQDLLIEVHYQTQDSTMTLLTNFHLELAVFDLADHFVTTADSRVANGYFHTLPPAGTVYCHLRRLPLMEGTYKIAAYLAIDGITSDYTPEIATLQVEAADYFQSGNRLLGGRQGVYMDQSWRDSPE